jgi:tryptophan-rich sensory protein
MKIQWKRLILCILIPLAVGGASAFLTRGNMSAFDSVAKPPLSPPAWLFPVAWTILYVLMGVASYLVLTSGMPARSRTALRVYGVQLFFNFFWSILFFNLQTYSFSFVWLVALLILVLSTTLAFWRISKPAGYLLIPYIIWVTFAGYLNLMIWLLNK